MAASLVTELWAAADAPPAAVAFAPPCSPPTLRRSVASSSTSSSPPASLALAPPGRREALQAPRHFFAVWQRRNEQRTVLWGREAVVSDCHRDPASAAAVAARPPTAAHAQLTTLHFKLQHLKAEIASLVAQDIALFRQLFSLQEAIIELREQCELSSCSSDESSPCSTLSSSSSFSNLGALSKHSSSFVRHHVSYPPIARNRSYRIKSSAPQHGCQDSYDSGIHTSDHEIFV